MPAKRKASSETSTATIGFEARVCGEQKTYRETRQSP